MSLAHDLTHAVRAGDAVRVRDLVVGSTEKERRSAADDMRRLLVSRNGRRSVAPVAFLGTATARDVASWGWVAAEAAASEVVADVLRARGRAFVNTLLRALERDLQVWRLVRVAVRAGIIGPPETDAWIRGMIAGITRFGGRDLESVYQGLLADPELLDADVWRIFEVDCGGELRWEVAYEHVHGEDGRLRFERGDNRWTYALRRLSDEGRLDRQRLIDASLEALMRDFRGTTIGWYVHFHEALEPTREEREVRVGRYLMLLATPTPTVAKLALASLKLLDDAVPAAELARAAVAPLAQRQKNLATATLSLLERAAARDPDAAPMLLEAAARAVAHERADVQERALQLIERYQDDPQTTAPARAVLLGLADAAAPTVRGRVAALTGIEPEADPSPSVDLPERSASARERLTLEHALSTRARLEPVESVDELIELAAALLEGQGDGDDAERLLDGVSRLCGERPPERLTAGLVKRARETSVSYYGLDGVGLIGTVVRAWAVGERPANRKYRGTALAFVLDRVNDVALRAARQQPRLLLASPTHSGGWLDPEVLAERDRRFGRFRNRPDASDRAQAVLRSRTLAALPLEPTIEQRKRWEFGGPEPHLSIRAVGDLTSLGPLQDAVVALAGATRERFWWLAPPAWGSTDALGARWCLTVVPSLPELAFAGSAAACLAAIDGGAAHDHPEVAFQHALDPAVPLAPIAWLSVAAALLGKAEDVRRPAADLIIQTVEDGRFEPDELGGALGWLLREQLGKLPRVVPVLRDVGRVSPVHAAAALATIEAALGELGQTPNGAHAVLELAVELAAATGRRLEAPGARRTLERMIGEVSQSAKLSKLARQLLA